jgi:hypothetical protein
MFLSRECKKKEAISFTLRLFLRSGFWCNSMFTKFTTVQILVEIEGTEKSRGLQSSKLTGQIPVLTILLPVTLDRACGVSSSSYVLLTLVSTARKWPVHIFINSFLQVEQSFLHLAYQSQSHLRLTVGQSVSMCWCRAQIWDFWPEIFF